MLLEANLQEADLSSAVFNTTYVDQTNFSRAKFYNTVVADCDLSMALGLDQVEHRGPSSIRLDTILRSGGNIPGSFLRGAGVPENVTADFRSLKAVPIEFYTCFISYSGNDQAFADRLYTDLQENGVRCWYYPESAVPGRWVWENINWAISVNDKLIVICSESSFTSPGVEKEIELPLDKEEAITRENTKRSKEVEVRGELPLVKDRDVLFPICI